MHRSNIATDILLIRSSVSDDDVIDCMIRSKNVHKRRRLALNNGDQRCIRPRTIER